LIEVLGRKSPISVRTDGVTVVLTLGNRSVSLDYDTANRLAVLLRGHGRIAKQNAGDMSLKVIGFAHLTDANLDELKAQKSRNGAAMYIQGSR
jgi:hypothetical protein